jgi:mono/diheme cytochrome c family protein
LACRFVTVGEEGSDAVVPGWLAGVVGEDQDCAECHGSGGGDEEIVEEGRQPEGHGGG